MAVLLDFIADRLSAAEPSGIRGSWTVSTPSPAPLEDCGHALEAAKRFDAEFRPKWPKPADRIRDGIELLTFYDFPAEHWIHRKTSNPGVLTIRGWWSLRTTGMSQLAVERPGVGCVGVLTAALGASGADDVAAVLVTASDPWGFGLDAARSVALIAVIDGWCWLRQPAAQPIGVAAGDLVLVPAARPGHGLASTPDEELAPCGAPTDSASAIDLAGYGSKTSLVYVAFEPASPVGRLLASRPAVVVRAGTHQQRGMLDATLRLLAAELVHDHPGAPTAVHRLVDVLVLQLLRAWMAQDQLDGVQWHPTALADETVTAALDLIHTEPARRWTIGTLAAEVGLSRAALVRRFTTTVGQPPSTYLTRWRLATAARQLRDTSEPLTTIAREVGYSSEFTFSRAFNRAYGQRPGRYRAAARRWVRD